MRVPEIRNTFLDSLKDSTQDSTNTIQKAASSINNVNFVQDEQFQEPPQTVDIAHGSRGSKVTRSLYEVKECIEMLGQQITKTEQVRRSSKEHKIESSTKEMEAPQAEKNNKIKAKEAEAAV